MGKTLEIETPRVFRPLLNPARYKGAYGGRGSGKSWNFGGMLVEEFIVDPATKAVCIREVQLSLEQSVKRLLEDTIVRYGVHGLFEIGNDRLVTRQGGIIIFKGMQTYSTGRSGTAESIKSLEGYDIAWVEEAQTLSERSLTLLRPTIRKDGSELWFSWNPRNATDPVDKLFRSETSPPGAVVVRANWQDNPWFPDVLRAEMEWDRGSDPEKYAHI